jgi:hypothetical protein
MRLLLLLYSLLGPSAPAPTTAGSPPPSPSAHAADVAPAPLSADELFSRRAMRRARLLIQMRVMELREERLECIKEALRRQLPSALWDEVPSPSRGTPNARSAAEKCEQAGPF